MPTDLMMRDYLMNDDDVTNERPDFENVDITLDGDGFTISKHGKVVAEYGIKVTFTNDGKYDMHLIKVK
jgi:hypothetical protein